MAMDEQHYKDSCLYSVEIAKQFITLASGGVAFVVASALAANLAVPISFFWSAGLFVLSITFGLIYVMSVIAHINKDQNYDVYSSQLKVFAGLQILSFLFSIILLAYVVLWKLESNSKVTDPNKEKIIIEDGSKKIIQHLEKNKNIELKIHLNGDIDYKTVNSQ